VQLLEVKGVAKQYGPVVALRDANLTVSAGEVHALLGANGAGKSTLVKILTGVIRPNAGTIAVHGRQVRVASPAAATRLGLAPVFQDPALVPDLTVTQNLRLTGVSVSAVRQRLAELELRLDFNDQIGDLPLPMLRMLDLARALARNPQLLLLDEITAALPSDLAERVFAVAHELKAQNRSVLFITHRLAEVIAHCDRATVLRDGQDVGVLTPSEGGEAQIVEYMLGPEAAAAAAQAGDEDAGRVQVAVPADAAPALEVRDLRASGGVEGVTLTVHKGEILGVAALEGQGQDALFETLAGVHGPSGGEIVVDGRPLRARTPYDAIRRGLVLVPADRLHALLPQRSVRENIAAPRYNAAFRWGPINMRDEGKRVGDAIQRLQIDTRAARQVRRLSGGNAQKVTIARWLANGFGTLLCFDPTRGIDVGTKRQIYALLRELAGSGASILLFTSELAEIPLVCDRVVVLYGGRIVAEMPAAAADEATILHAAHGLAPSEEAAA
jgi:ribose transport system ATP-binding protein